MEFIAHSPFIHRAFTIEAGSAKKWSLTCNGKRGSVRTLMRSLVSLRLSTLRCGLMSGTQQVGKQPIGARDELGQLQVQCVGNIYIGALALMRDQQTAALRILTGIGSLGESRVAWVPGIEE